MAALPYPAYGFSTTLLPDGGETPYPAYVYERNPWLRCRFIAGWRRKRLIRPTFSGATRCYGALYCRMAALPYPAYGSLL